MDMLRTYFLIALFISLSANVFSQIDYDSIAIDLGYLLEENFSYNEDSLFREKFNNETFLSFINLKDPDGNQNVEEFNEKFAAENFGAILFNRLEALVSGESSYKFINYSVDEVKNIYLIFRLYSEEAGINYHQYLFEPSGIGSYRITDVYFFLNGEYFSKTLETHYYNTLESVVGLEEGNENNEFKTAIALVRIRRLIDTGNLKKARKIFYRDLSEEERSKKDYIFLELELTDVEDVEAYKSLTERMVNFAEEGNPSFYLSAIDFYYLDEKYHKVIEVVDSLYSFTGDTFLEIYKASSYLELEDYESAEQSLIKANEHHPGMYTTYDMLFYFYELRDELPKFLNVLDTMSKYLNIDYKFLEKSVPLEYPQFVANDTYKDWITERLNLRKIKADSLAMKLSGQWVFQGSQDFEGNDIETSLFWVGDYGKTRPNLNFSEDKNYHASINNEPYKQGIWDFDFGHNTIDFFVPFDEKTSEGKEIIEGGYYEVIDEDFFETYSYYYFSIENDVLKLYDVDHGLNIYKKLK